jgi:hypothetical protein
MAGGGQGGRWLNRKQAPRLPAGTGHAPTVRGCSGRRHGTLLRLQACVSHLFPPFPTFPTFPAWLRRPRERLWLSCAACHRGQSTSAGAPRARARAQSCQANHAAGPGGAAAQASLAGGWAGGRWLGRKQAPRLPAGTGHAPTVRGCSGRRHGTLLRLQARIPCHSVPFRAIPCHSVPFRAIPQRWAVDGLPLGRAACQRWQGASAGALGARGRAQPCQANHTAGPGGPTRAWQAWQEVGSRAAAGWITSRHPACPRAPAMPPRCAAALAGAIAPCCGCRRAFPTFSRLFPLFPLFPPGCAGPGSACG